MASASARVEWDMDALQRAAARSDDVRGALVEATDRIVATANAMGSGTRSGGHGYKAKGTGKPRKGQGWLEHENSPAAVTGPAAEYEGNVRMFHDGYMGIVYTANYSAQLDNHRNNTLLKAKGTGKPRNGQGWLEHENSPAAVTGPAAEYAGNVRMFHEGYMGIVYTANYSAQLDNHRNNTLLKAKG